MSAWSRASNAAFTIWNLDTGQRTATLAGHSGFIDDLVFNSDGTRIRDSQRRRLIRLSDPASGQEQMALRSNVARVYSVSFSPDGRWLASYGAEGTTRVWALDVDELADIARQGITRTLTNSECERYLPDSDCSQP